MLLVLTFDENQKKNTVIIRIFSGAKGLVNEGSLSFSNANNYKRLNHLIRLNPQCQIQILNASNNLTNIQRMIMSCIRKNEVLPSITKITNLSSHGKYIASQVVGPRV